MNSETTLMQRIQVYASSLSWRLFRNNAGLAWTGTPVPIKGTPHVLLQNARRIKFGLCVGSSDLIGWRPVLITSDMVGKTIAQFVAAEIKTPSGRPTQDQSLFLHAVNINGGHARIVRTEADLTLTDR